MQRKLNECEIGGRYVVAGVQVDEGITRRLEALGVNEGTPVNILTQIREWMIPWPYYTHSGPRISGWKGLPHVLAITMQNNLRTTPCA